MNMIIGPREPGKTTHLSARAWTHVCKCGETLVYLARNPTLITDQLVEKVRGDMNKFFEVPPFYMNSAAAKTGNVDVYCEGFPVMRIVALNMGRDLLKKVTVPHPSFILFDEFLRDTKAGDRYLTDEAGRFKELYSTIVREHRGLKAYFIGNIYSLYNPYALDWGVDTTKLRPGMIYANDKCAVEMVTLTDKLKKEIIRKNPFYEFDDFYSRYAIDGKAKNDGSIVVVKSHPRNYSLDFTIRTGSRLIGVYSRRGEKAPYKYWVGWANGNERKKAYAYDIKEVVENTKVVGRMDRYITYWFREAMGEHQVAFGDLACYYLIEEIYARL